LFATLLAGAAGNLLTALVYGSPHDVVGASTATFAALGLLGGLQFMRRYAARTVGRFKRAFLLGIAASLGLFACWAWASGPTCWLTPPASALAWLRSALGHFVASLGKPLGQAICLIATVVAVAGAWLLAFRHDRRAWAGAARTCAPWYVRGP